VPGRCERHLRRQRPALLRLRTQTTSSHAELTVPTAGASAPAAPCRGYTALSCKNSSCRPWTVGLRDHAGNHPALSVASASGQRRCGTARQPSSFPRRAKPGLDPATSSSSWKCCADLADTAGTIVCTTQVMENAFLMDQLIILVGGCLAFQGRARRQLLSGSQTDGALDQLLARPPKHWPGDFPRTHPSAAPWRGRCRAGNAAPSAAPRLFPAHSH